MKFIKNKPALLLEDISAVAITDLHIGLEYDLYRSGVRIPQQTERLKAEIKKIVKKAKAERLLVLGDIKHIVPGTSFQERREIPEFFQDLVGIAEIHVTPGNHDSNIQEMLPPEVILHQSEGFLMGKYYFSHGHTWPSKDLIKADTFITGHTHPTVEFKDSLGYRITKPVFLKGFLEGKKVKERYGVGKRIGIVVLPPFNGLFSGSPINGDGEDILLGPIFRNRVVDIKECEAYLLDGTFLGKVKDI
ncbi:hypothetical protein A3K63_01430 [Candidatus Micrarchaeota archaeon RBG_16_49_10]|nr:MAG: hypothetical protein A3K63_01430 [Candidatus Micrarchaeota archaeon RBG_16_49_10]